MMVILQRLWIQITADRRRFAMFCGAVAVGLLLWARIIIISDPPRTALATESDIAIGATLPVLSSGSTDKGPDEVIEIALAQQPRRDPFSISEQHFPKPTTDIDLHQDVGKSPSQTAENAQNREARLVALLKELVGQLDLEAIMRPMAVINGATYRQGDLISIDGHEGIVFEITEVSPRSVVLQFEERTFVLKMGSARE